MSSMRQLIDSVIVESHYAKYANPNWERAILVFMAETKHDIRYTNSMLLNVLAAVVKVRDDHAAQIAQDGEGDPLDLQDVFCELTSNSLEKVHHVADHHRLNDYFERKPDVEASDELTFLQDEDNLSKALSLSLDPASPHSGFSFVIEGLSRLSEDWTKTYNYGFDDEVRDTLKVVLPLVLMFLRVAAGTVTVEQLLGKYL